MRDQYRVALRAGSARAEVRAPVRLSCHPDFRSARRPAEWEAGNEGASQRHTLLFTAGELHRVMIETVRQSTRVRRSRLGRRLQDRAGSSAGSRTFSSRSAWDQLERLKDEADFAAAHFRHAIFGKIRNIFTIEKKLPAGGIIQARQQSEKSAFSAAGWTHNCGELPARMARSIPRRISTRCVGVWMVRVSRMTSMIGREIGNSSGTSVMIMAVSYE